MNTIPQIYSPVTIAEWFINKFNEHGDLITHLKVQKLLYYAEGWTQISLDRTLFNDRIEAWAHGPVVPSVFQTYKEHQWQPLPPTTNQLGIDERVEEILELVYDTYGDFSAKTLEEMTHRDQPWIDARDGYSPEERCNQEIPKPEIKAYFHSKFAEYI